jgi:hypothetical protein
LTLTSRPATPISSRSDGPNPPTTFSHQSNASAGAQSRGAIVTALVALENEIDALYEELGRHFSEKEIVDLTLAVIAINDWNRLAIPFRSADGTYQPYGGADHKSAKP